MLARKLFFYILPPLVLAAIGGGVYWRSRKAMPAVDEPAPPVVVQPADQQEAALPQADDSGSAPAGVTATDTAAANPATASPQQVTPSVAAPITAEELLANATEFSASPLWAKFLAQTTPAMRLVKAIDAVAHGERPLDALDFLHVETPFAARRNAAGDWVPEPAAYARYQTAVDFVDSLDPQKAAEWFLRAEPVLQQCCKKLGYQDKSIRALLTEACNTILATPRFDFDPQLVPTGTTGTYHYADPAFEQLNDAQKLLVRLGPANCAKVQAKCEAIADALHLYKTSE